MKRAATGLLTILGLTVAGLLTPAAADGDTLLVHVTGGAVQGVNLGAVSEWRGVPYAAPPVGNLRWRPPAPVPSWSGVRDATEFAPACAQLGFESPVEGSEDCLYVNVSAPAGTRAGQRLPVMVHLHGGSNWFFHAYRNADAFVQHGVIVVTVGYRLGVFGFTGHPAFSAEAGGSSGEYGVLDQLAALHWVQANIADFGGDARNVTLFGESAGSFDAVALAASPLGRGLFARLAAQTEAVWGARGTGTISDAESLGLGVAETVGCSASADAAACLRAKSTDALVLASGEGDVAPWVGGTVLPASPLQLIAAQASPVPMLLGSNREEAAFWLFENVAGGVPYGTDGWIRDTNAITGPSNGPTVRAMYPPEAYGSRLWASVAAFTDGIYTCSMRRLALTSRGVVYRYLYTHVTQNDPIAAALRASHFLDEPFLWHDGSLLGGYTFTAAEETLSARMVGYWTNFAKSGDPNGPGLPTWPRYTSTTERITVLDEPGAQLSAYHTAECAYFDAHAPVFGPPTDFAPGRIPPR